MLQACTNTDGGYECSCREGFRLDAAGDNSSCLPEEQAGHMAGRPTFTSGSEGGGGCVARCDTSLVKMTSDSPLSLQLSHCEEAQDARGEPRGEGQKPRHGHQVHHLRFG